MYKYFWAQVNESKIAHCKYFRVGPSDTLDKVVSRYYSNYEIVYFEEVTREYAEKHAKRILG